MSTDHATDIRTGYEATEQTPLEHYAPKKNASFGIWAQPIHERLEGFLSSVNNLGAQATKGELMAAIVSFVELDPEELLDIVHRYRTATAGDIKSEPGK